MLALLFTAWQRPSLGSWTLVARVPYDGAYTNGQPALAQNGSFAFASPSGTFRYDSKIKKLITLCGPKAGTSLQQADCGLGLFAYFVIASGGPMSIRVIRVSTGEEVFATTRPGFYSWKRVGRLLVGPSYIRDDFRHSIQARPGGPEVLNIETKQPVKGYKPEVAWDSPSMRLIFRRKPERTPTPSPYFQIGRCASDSFSPTQWRPVGRYEMSFDRIIGNPETGAFAVMQSFAGASVENEETSGIRADFRNLDPDPPLIRDISKLGVICSGPHKYPSTTDAEPIWIEDPKTGRTLWKRTMAPDVHWLGRYVRASGSTRHRWELFDGTTGHPAGDIAFPVDGDLSSEIGNLFLFRDKRGFELYRLHLQ